MNRKSGSGSGPFLMEMLVVVGFFIICASICVMVFVKSDRISRDARDINQAVLMAQSLAEELKAGQEPQWSGTLPDRNIWEHLVNADNEDQARADWLKELTAGPGYEGMHAIYWDSEWQVTEPSSHTPYLGIIYQGTVDSMRRADILVMRYDNGGDKGKVLYRLQTEDYEDP